MAATKLRIYNDAARILADAMFALITDETETRHQMDNAWQSVVPFVLGQAPWRFALKTATLSGGGSPVTGFASSYVYPSDWLRTHSIKKVGSDGRENPIDLREQGIVISANATGLTIRYVSSDYADPELANHPWPEHFAQAVAAYLAFSVAERVTGERGAANPMSQLFNQLLGEAIRLDAIPEDRWMPFQRTGEMLLGARDMLRRGNWRFALIDVDINPIDYAGGTGIGGFTKSFQYPPGWLRTHKLFLTSALIPECPFDIREQAGSWGTNADTFVARIVSWEVGFDSSRWEEPFRDALLAFLEAGRPEDEPQTQDGRRQVPEWQRLLALALEASANPDDRWLPHQMSGRFQRVARDVLSKGFWRFAMTAAVPSATTGALPGYSSVFAHPADMVRPRALYIADSGRESPFDVRDHEAKWSTNVAAFTVQYVSSAGLDSTIWPEPFAMAVLARLEMETAPEAAMQAAAAASAAAFDDAARAYSLPSDPWLTHQLSGLFERGKRAVLEQGYWVFRDPDGVMRGLHERQYSYLDDQRTDPVTYPTAYAFPYRYPLPDDHFKTHALFLPWDGEEQPINISETAHEWSTDAASFIARYVSTEVLDAVLWPQAISKAVLAWADWQTAPANEARLRAEEYAEALAAALKAYSREENEWLRFQLDGSFQAALKEVLEKGRWRFAVRTVDLVENTDPLPSELAEGTPSPSYADRYIWPSDMIRPLRVYYLRGTGPYAERIDVDYRDEQGSIHANYAPVTVRYVSRLGMDPTRWPAHFRDALLAWLQYREARGDPKKAAIARIKMEAYELACKEAERLDDARDMPVIVGSRFTAARRGYGSGRAREQGWYLLP